MVTFWIFCVKACRAIIEAESEKKMKRTCTAKAEIERGKGGEYLENGE